MLYLYGKLIGYKYFTPSIEQITSLNGMIYRVTARKQGGGIKNSMRIF
jgi:hypothetical protein